MLLLSHLLWWQAGSSSPPTQADTVLGEFLHASQTPVQVVVSDFSVVLISHMMQGRLSLNEYAGWDYEKLRPSPAEPRLLNLFDVLRTHRLTRFGDLNIASRILDAGIHQDRRIVIRHAREVSARDFKTGNHVILGNLRSTPWAGLFEDRLNFQIGNGPDGAYGFLNRKPKPNEQSAYLARETQKEYGPGYARLAVVPNLSGTGRVLLITGVNMVTMEAAGEYAACTECVPEFLEALGNTRLDALPYFETVIETSAVENTPHKARAVAARVIPLHP